MRANKPEDVWARIDKGAPDECWPWRGATFPNGYARFCIDCTSRCAHVVVFEVSGGIVPLGLLVMHRCNNRICCNPAHLEAGSNSRNQRHASSSGAFPVGVTGRRGIGVDRSRGYWTAQGYLNGKKSNLYTGPSLEKAVAARARWEAEHGVRFPEQERTVQ